MLSFHTGDVFDTKQPAIAHGINASANMNGGFARIIQTKYPDVFKGYMEACERGSIVPGGYFAMVPINDPRWILNLVTQDLPGANARIDWVEGSLHLVAKFCLDYDISGFASPRIGSGIGGLEQDDVEEVYVRLSEEFPILDLEIWSL